MNYVTRSEIATGEIRALLGRNRQAIKELSHCTGISLSTLNARLLGKRGFTIDELDSIALFFGVPLVVLLQRRDLVAQSSASSSDVAERVS